MNAHDEMETLAGVHAAGGLEPDERRALEAHAGSCAPCGAILREARDFDAWARGAVAPDAPPAGLEDRIVARLFTKAAPKKERRSRPALRKALKTFAGLAAAVAFVFLGALFTSPGQGWFVVDADYPGVDLALVDKSGSVAPSFAVEGAKAFEQDFAVYPPRRAQTFHSFSDTTRARLLAQSGVQDGEAAFKGGDRLGFGYSGPVVDTTTKSRNRLNFTADTPVLANSRRLQQAGAAGEGRKVPEQAKPDDIGVDIINRANAPLRGAEELAKRMPKGIAALEESDHNETADAEKFDKANRGRLTSETGATFTLDDGKREDLRKELEQLQEARSLETKPVQDNRKIIRNADLHLEVEGYEATYTKVNEIVAAEKGFVAGANTQRLANGKIRATVTVRVPPERFEATLAKFRDLGTVRHQNITSQDVTKAYVDLQARLGAKESLVERLKKVLAEARGSVKELMEVEVQMGKTLEEIEAIKGELKYYDNLVGLSTIILQISEKDLGQPFEYVQTLQSTIGLTTRDADDVYAKAQMTITDAGGQVVDSRMNRQNDGSADATVKGRVDAEKFPAVREALKKLGHVDADTVTQQKTARGGSAGAPKPDAPLRREQAAIDLAIKTPPIQVTRTAQITVELDRVEETYQSARKAAEEAGGKILDGSLRGTTDGTQAHVVAQVDAARFAALVESFKAIGKLKNAEVNQAVSADISAKLVTEKGQITFVILSPPRLIPEEKGLGKTIRDTFSGSVAGLLWSVEKLFVGLSLAGPWIALALAAWILWRRWKRKAKPQAVG